MLLVTALQTNCIWNHLKNKPFIFQKEVGFAKSKTLKHKHITNGLFFNGIPNVIL